MWGAHAQSCTYGGVAGRGSACAVHKCRCVHATGSSGGADKGVDVNGAQGTRTVRGMGLHACTAVLACSAVHPCTVVHTQEGMCVCSVCLHLCACKHALHIPPEHACSMCTVHACTFTHTHIRVHPMPVHPCMCALCLHVQGCMCAELKAGTGGTCSVHTSRAHHPWGVEVPGECMQGCVCACMGTRVCGGVCICA